MLGDYDSIQEWNVAKLFCSFNILLTNPKQYIFSTNTCSRNVLFCDEKLHFINSFISSFFTLILMMWKVKKKTHKNPKAEWEALKENNSVVLAKPWKHILLRRGKHTVIHITGKWVQLYRFLFSKKKSQSLFLEFSIIYRVLVLNIHYSKVFLIPTRNTSRTKQFISLRYLMWGWYNWNSLKGEKIFKVLLPIKIFP